MIKNNKKKEKTSKKNTGTPENKGSVVEYLFLMETEVDVQGLTMALYEETEIIQGLPLTKENVEIWKELNLAEVILANDSLVFEDMDDVMDSEEDQSILAHYNIKKVYAFNYNTLDQGVVGQIMQHLLAKFGGYIAADTEDFQPMGKELPL